MMQCKCAWQHGGEGAASPNAAGSPRRCRHASAVFRRSNGSSLFSFDWSVKTLQWSFWGVLGAVWLWHCAAVWQRVLACTAPLSCCARCCCNRNGSMDLSRTPRADSWWHSRSATRQQSNLGMTAQLDAQLRIV